MSYVARWSALGGEIDGRRSGDATISRPAARSRPEQRSRARLYLGALVAEVDRGQFGHIGREVDDRG